MRVLSKLTSLFPRRGHPSPGGCADLPRNAGRGAEPRRRVQRRGVIFIAAIGIVIVLGTLVLVLTQEMRVEAVASANRLAAVKADAVEQGAEQWVLAQIALNTTDAVTIENTPAEGIKVGDAGYFWIIRPDPEDATQYCYGICDECGKLNINSATATQLLYLPNMNEDLAGAIVEWRGGGGSTGPGSMYYGSLAEPYREKLANYESVEELLLVKDVTPDLLWGMDRNRDNVVSDVERNGAGSSGFGGAFGGATGGTVGGVADQGNGWFPYLTVYSVSSGSTGGGGTPGGGATGGTGATGGQRRATTVIGRVNVNTASTTVLQCLGLSESEAESVVSAREANSGSGIIGGTQWLSSAIGGKAQTLSQYITGASNEYSADIVGVSADGRAFKRVRIVIDARSTPAKVLYRKDLTEFGWPLPPEHLQSLKDGKGPIISDQSINNPR